MATNVITGKSIAAFWARCTVGTRMTCIANTYNRNAPGATGVVAKPGKTNIRLMQDDGKYFHIYPPQRVKDIVNLTDDTITYLIPWNGKPSIEGHTATWRIDAKEQPR